MWSRSLSSLIGLGDTLVSLMAPKGPKLPKLVMRLTTYLAATYCRAVNSPPFRAHDYPYQAIIPACRSLSHCALTARGRLCKLHKCAAYLNNPDGYWPGSYQAHQAPTKLLPSSNQAHQAPTKAITRTYTQHKHVGSSHLAVSCILSKLRT